MRWSKVPNFCGTKPLDLGPHSHETNERRYDGDREGGPAHQEALTCSFLAGFGLFNQPAFVVGCHLAASPKPLAISSKLLELGIDPEPQFDCRAGSEMIALILVASASIRNGFVRIFIDRLG